MKNLSSAVLLALVLSVTAGGAFAQTASTPSTAGNGTVARTPSPSSGNPAASPRVPGGTGNTAVNGNNSTIRSDRSATVEQKTGQVGGGK